MKTNESHQPSNPSASMAARESPGFMTPTSAAGGADRELRTGRWELDLSSTYWQFEGIRPGHDVKAGFHLHLGEYCSSTLNWNSTEVPGDVYIDLLRAGEIDDPRYGRNGTKAKWALERVWWYRCKFKVPESQCGRALRLMFVGVDYASEVWLNGKRLGRHEGMFSPFEFNVDPLLCVGDDGENGLVVKPDPPPRAYRDVAGRKFGWHGDHWRTLTPMGIWKPIRLVATGPVHLSDVYPQSKLHADGSATVTMQKQLATHRSGVAKGVRVQAVIRGANCEAGPFALQDFVARLKATHGFELVCTIPQAKLWWPWDLGEPNLYQVEVTVLGPDGTVWDTQVTRFGIREICTERNPGYSADVVMYPWTLVIKGLRAFYRSANCGGPPDIFYGRGSPREIPAAGGAREGTQLEQPAHLRLVSDRSGSVLRPLRRGGDHVLAGSADRRGAQRISCPPGAAGRKRVGTVCEQLRRLRGDQDQAKAECGKLLADLRGHKSKLHSTDYCRFFPTMSGSERTRQVGNTPDKAVDFTS